ncbi:MAG: uroporphyrinogen-III C-methyltransferase [Ideonella sp.]|nr:uroporphyrinogen-III C-methyltransferase [Ideonella sp.]
MNQRQALHAPRPGHICFIGAGPGAADLITLRGAQALAHASVVLFDALTDPGFQALAPQALWVDVGKRGFCSSTLQAHINALLVHYGRQGERVARLKGGDPSVFGRLEEEIEALAPAGLSYEVIPGITAALAAAAATGRPLTRRGRGRSVALSTAMTREGAFTAGQRADTEVFYMAGRQLAALSRRLLDAGWVADTPVLVVSRAGCADQSQSDHTVATLAATVVLHAGRPTVVTVGVGASPLGVNAPAAVAEISEFEGHRAEALAST